MKHELVWIDYEDGSDILIGYRDKYNKVVDGPEMTLEDIAEFCDLNAEGRNNHSLVGLHRLIAAILYNKFGREAATETLRTIAEFGGLDEMGGAFSELGIPEPWNEWKLG
jgi:hypothetical protein